MMARKLWRVEKQAEVRGSFNGAAPMMARKPAELELKRRAQETLQWSRANDGAETL